MGHKLAVFLGLLIFLGRIQVLYDSTLPNADRKGNGQLLHWGSKHALVPRDHFVLGCWVFQILKNVVNLVYILV
jgi:hypothetical protein